VHRFRARLVVPFRAPLKNQCEQTDNNEQADEKNDADGSADKFQHDCLLLTRTKFSRKARQLDPATFRRCGLRPRKQKFPQWRSGRVDGWFAPAIC
jgi:hypothetical protein